MIWFLRTICFMTPGDVLIVRFRVSVTQHLTATSQNIYWSMCVRSLRYWLHSQFFSKLFLDEWQPGGEPYYLKIHMWHINMIICYDSSLPWFLIYSNGCYFHGYKGDFAILDKFEIYLLIILKLEAMIYTYARSRNIYQSSRDYHVTLQKRVVSL